MKKKVDLNESKPLATIKKVKAKKNISVGPYTLEFTPSEFNASQTNLGSPILNQLQTEGYKGGDGLDALSLNTFTLQGANFGTSFKTLKNVNANIDIPSVVTGSTYKADWYYLFNIVSTGLTINLLIDVLVDGSTATFFNNTGLNATINILSDNGNSTALIPPLSYLDITLVTASPYKYTTVYRSEGIQGTIVGEYKFVSFMGDILPNFLECNGRAISRTTYSYYFSLITFNLPGNLSVGSPIITGLTEEFTYNARVGMPVEGASIPSGAQILSIDSLDQITLTMNATSSTTENITFFIYGNGDGSTTFNIPDFTNGSYGGRVGLHYQSVYGNGYPLGSTGGSATSTLTSPNQLPSHTHGVTDGGHAHAIGIGNSGGGASGEIGNGNSVPTKGYQNTETATTGISIDATGSSASFDTISPYATENRLVRVL